MARWVRVLSPLFLISLLAFVGGGFALAFLHGTVIECTVGFRTSGQPLTASQAAQCPAYEVASGVLIAVALVAGTVLIWLGLKAFGTNSPGPSEHEGSVPSDGAASSTPPSPTTSRRAPWPTSRWVCLLVALFFAVTFFTESWQYLQLIHFSDDLSINQQLLSSSALGGRPYPLYNSFTCGLLGDCTFLQEHQAFLAFPVALTYGIAPTPFTLFALQSLALALGALPLYVIANDVIGSKRLSLVVVVTYLAWLPLFIAASRDTFHWEALLPVEMLTLFMLWNRQRYLYAIPVVLLAFCTLEVTTVLAFAVGVFFLWPWLVKSARLLWNSALWVEGESKGFFSWARHWRRWVWKSLHVPEVYASLALMAGSVAAYFLLRLFGSVVGSLFGIPPLPAAYAAHASFLNRTLSFGLPSLTFMWTAKLWFWIVFYLTLGLIPLIAPRTLILVLPWMAFTFFNLDAGFWGFSGIYQFVPAAALMIGFVFGLERLYRWTSAKRPVPLSGSEGVGKQPNGAPEVASRPRFRPWSPGGAGRAGSSTAARILFGGLVVLVAGNLFLNPLNPLAASIVPNLGAPFPSPYGVNWAPPQEEQALDRLVSVIPKNAVVTAPPLVFTLIADDPYAYPMESPSTFHYPLLPGNMSNRVQYVLLPYTTPVGRITPQLLGTLYDRSIFGVRGCVANSTFGGVELFQRNYSGAPETFGPAGALCPNYFAGGTGLTPGPNSTVATNTSSPSGVVVRSTPCLGNDTVVWTGPGVTLPAGQYGLRVVFNAYNATGTACLKKHVSSVRVLFTMNVTGQNASGVNQIIRHVLNVTAVQTTTCSQSPSCTGWIYWNATLNLATPMSDVSVLGTVMISQYTAQVAYVVLVPDQS